MGGDLAVGRLLLVNSSSLWGKRVRLQTRGTAGKRNKGSDNQIEEEELEKNSTTMRNDDTYKARRLLYG